RVPQGEAGPAEEVGQGDGEREEHGVDVAAVAHLGGQDARVRVRGFAAGTSGLTVLQNGKVGIGNSAPSATFDVTGTGRFSSTLTMSSVITCVGSQALQTDGSGNIVCGPVALGGATSGGGWTTDSIGKVALSTTTDRVAIGATSNPYAKLTVLSGSAATTTLALFPASGQTANILDIYNGSGSLYSVISAVGNLGLGTTSPFALFSLAGSAGGTSNLFALSTSTAAFATTTALTIDRNGNLALLNGANLSVGGNLTVTGTTAHTGLTTFTNGFISNASSTITSGLFSMSGGASTTQLTTTSSTYLASLGGNVGIGTTTPYSKLSVWGSGTGTNRLFELTNFASTTLASILENGTAYLLGNLGLGTTSPSQLLSVHGNGLFSGNLTAANITATGTLSVTGVSTFVNASTTNLSISSNLWVGGNATTTSTGTFTTNGSVGIGVTSPTYALDVSGLGHFTGLVDAANFVATSTSITSIFRGGILANNASSTITNLTMVNATSTNATTTSFAISNLTSGRIPFITTGGSLADSGNFLWNNATNLFTVTGNASTTQLTTTNSTYLATTGGNVGIGTTSPSQLLSVHGNGLFSGNLTLAGLTATGTIAINSAARTAGAT
ncbi:MAG: hypothetical protein AAB794_03320, partial [Patescibacteria group bacterium]